MEKRQSSFKLYRCVCMSGPNLGQDTNYADSYEEKEKSIINKLSTECLS
jgi:hypothetical protein